MLFSAPKKEVDFAHKLVEDIRRRLLITTLLGGLTVISTGLSAAFGYYTKDLPATIKALTLSVESLRHTVKQEETINERQDYIQHQIEKRVERLEDDRK